LWRSDVSYQVWGGFKRQFGITQSIRQRKIVFEPTPLTINGLMIVQAFVLSDKKRGYAISWVIHTNI